MTFLAKNFFIPGSGLTFALSITNKDMTHSKLKHNEIVQYIGEDIMYGSITILKSGENVHIERQYTQRKVVVLQCKNNGYTYTLRLQREVFNTLPGRPCLDPFVDGKEQEIMYNIKIANINLRYVLGELL